MSDQIDTFRIELVKGLMTLPIEGLKMLCLINGGAIVAVLTYLGNIVSHTQSTPNGNIAVAHFGVQMLPAVIWYCAGLSIAALDLLVAYLTQLAFSVSVERERAARKPSQFYRILVVFGSTLGALSIASFVGGSLTAAHALSTFGSR